MSHNSPDIIQSSAGLVADVRSMVEQTREGVARTVNTGMTLLYWRIGKRVQVEVLENKRAEYGKGIVSTLSRQLGWSHFKEIIYLKEPLQREFYAEMCRVERWSVRTLRKKIDSMLYERTALSKKPEAVAQAEIAKLRSDDHLTPALVFKDPYVLNNADRQNRDIALKSLITQAVNKERRRELELYKLYAADGDFKKEFDAMIARILALEEREPPA